MLQTEFARNRWYVAGYATGVGLVLLAYASNGLQECYLATPLRTFTSRTIADHRQLRSVLAEVRRVRYAVSDGQVTLDALSIAAPVHGSDGEVVPALSIVVRAGQVPGSALAPAVASARGISRALATRWTGSSASMSRTR